MQLQEMSWPQVAGTSKDVPVVVPIAAVEQHGHHLPVFTDSMLLGEVVRRASEALGDRAIWTPLLWLGNSHHHIDFAGTLSAAPRTYLDLLGDLIDNLIAHGFRRIVLLNGHGGNIVPASQAVFEARQRHRQRDELLLLSVGDLLALGGKPDQVRSLDRAGSDGARLRMGNLDDPANGTPTGRRHQPDRAGPSGRIIRAGHSRLDHAGAEPRSDTSATRVAPRPRRGRRCSGSSPTTSSPSSSG